MNTKLASAFGLAMLAVAFSFSTSFACSETSHTTASVVESVVSESGMNVTPLAEASAPEGQGKYPPAEPGALEMGPLEAAVGVADVIRHEVTCSIRLSFCSANLRNTSPRYCLSFP